MPPGVYLRRGSMHALVCPLCHIALPPVDDVCPRDGHTGREVAWTPVPASLGQRFQILEPFAHGDTGSLYIADEPETGRRGLLKILAPVAKDQLAERQRLRRELIKQATLLRTNLVLPLASAETEGSTWLFREWLDGITLEVRLSREGALQQTEALAIAAQIASALDELHRGGLLHRDVKPGHILLQPTPQGIPRALLLDAGVTRVLGASGGGVTMYGSAGYVAPEQLLGKLVSFRSDLYSLGCVLYRMLTGRPAFAGDTLEATLAAQRQGELPAMPADLPNGIGALLQSILAKDPQQRPFSAQKLRRTLDPFLPDGALMEKQSTTTFETVPEPKSSIAPQPSGTLRPPAPPSVRPSLAAPAAPSMMRPGARSAPPPAPPRSAALREERTQQIDLSQIEEMRSVPPRGASVPPPTPGKVSSIPPPTPRSAPLSDKTQPIRLDQILAVASAQRVATSSPPPARRDEAVSDQDEGEEDEERTVVQEAPSAAALRLSQRPLFASQDEPFRPPSEPAPQLFQPPVTQPRPAQPFTNTAPASFMAQNLPGQAGPKSPVAQVGTQLGTPFTAPQPAEPQLSPQAAAAVLAPAAEGPDAPEQPPAQAAAPARPVRKQTLMGMGLTPGASNPLSAAAAAPAALADSHALPQTTLPGMPQPSIEPSLELPTQELHTRELRRERDHPTERMPLTGAGEASDEDGLGTSMSLPSGAIAEPTRDPRRLIMYASAALVGLAVLGLGASALFSEPEVVAARSAENNLPPPLPAAVAAQEPAPKTVALAEGPRPTVEPLGPSVEQLPPSVAAAANTAPPTAAPVAQPSAAPSPASEPLRAAPSKPERAPREAAVAASTPSSSKRASSDSHGKASSSGTSASRDKEARASAKSSTKSAASDKGGDKAALFATAREEARNAYAAKKYKEAAAAFERATKYDSKHPGSFAGLGAARLQLGENKAAVQAYQRAVHLSPETSGFHAALGRAYLSVGEKAKAIASYKKALAADPKNEAAKVALKQIGS